MMTKRLVQVFLHLNVEVGDIQHFSCLFLMKWFYEHVLYIIESLIDLLLHCLTAPLLLKN